MSQFRQRRPVRLPEPIATSPTSSARLAWKASASPSSATARSSPKPHAETVAARRRSNRDRRRRRRRLGDSGDERPHRQSAPGASMTRWSSPAAPIARACWSAPASTGISRRRARRSTPRAREIVTVAIRRTNIGQDANEPSLLDCAAAVGVHAPAQHRRLLHRRRRGAHAEARARAARRPRAGQARGAGRPAHAVSRTCARRIRAAETLVSGRLQGDGVHVRRSDHRARARSRSAASRSCRSPR